MRMLGMKHKLLWITLLWAPNASGQAPDAVVDPLNMTDISNFDLKSIENSCYVCGVGGEIDNPSRMITTSFGMFTCRGLAGAGTHGTLKEGECPLAMAAVAEQCGCATFGEDYAGDGDIDIFGCNICPEDGIVTTPGGIIELPNAAVNRTCGEYLLASAEGIIQKDQCIMLQNYTAEACGCTDPLEFENLSRPDVSNETFVCPVCGVDMVSSTPDAIVNIPTQPERTCREIEVAAAEGKIPEVQCNLIKAFVEDSCQCMDGTPVEPEPTRPPGAYDCQICGEGNVVSTPNAVVTIPTQPDRTCADLLNANRIGNINQEQCILLQPFVRPACGCIPRSETSEPTASPTDSPTIAPTTPQVPTSSPAPTGWATQQQECFDNLLEIYELEKAVEDVSERRRYVLCPGTTFELGRMDEEGRILKGGVFLMPRPNVMYQCGDDGRKENNCILKGGDFGLVSFYGVYNGIYETVENVRIRGLTFESQTLIGAALEAAGDIQFIDCVFQEHDNLAPILMQWRGEGPKMKVEQARERKLRSITGPESNELLQFKQRMLSKASAKDTSAMSHRRLQEGAPGDEFEQRVTFRNCIFRDNFVSEKMGFPGIIENSFGSELNIIESVFMDNMYGSQNNPAPFGYAVRSFGPVTIESTCFQDNVFHGQGPVNVFGAPHTTSNNYIRSFQTDITCEFLAVFATLDDTTTEKPVCFDSDANTCPIDIPPSSNKGTTNKQPAPTAAPVASPTIQTPSAASSTFSTFLLLSAGLVSTLLLVGGEML